MIKQHKRIIFNGNNYSDEWQKEAKKRGLLNLRNTVDALPELVSKPVIAAFTKHKVLNERELKAREEINFEAYNKTINIEAQLMVLMANRYILPAALEYTRLVGQAVVAAKAGGVGEQAGQDAAVNAGEAERQAEVDVGRAGQGAGAQRRQLARAREVLPRQGHPADGDACATPATPSS